MGLILKKRKHVDWEIYAGLKNSINGCSGLVGILLPEIDIYNDKYDIGILPDRLEDNVNSKYADIYTWNYAIQNFDEIINKAFDNRIIRKDKIDNTRIQMKQNRA